MWNRLSLIIAISGMVTVSTSVASLATKKSPNEQGKDFDTCQTNGGSFEECCIIAGGTYTKGVVVVVDPVEQCLFDKEVRRTLKLPPVNIQKEK